LNRSETNIPVPSYKPLTWFFVLTMIATHLFFLWNVRTRIARGDPDFTVFYTAAKILRGGHAARLYGPSTQWAVQREFTNNSDRRAGPLPFIHPPFEALLFVTYFSYPAAFTLWSVLNLGLLCAVVLVVKPLVGFLEKIPWWEAVLGTLAFFPIFANFHQGQDAILLLLVVSFSYRALTRNAYFIAGSLLGLGMFKYHLILPLFLVVGVWKGRKFVCGFLAITFLLALLSVGMVGWHGAIRYPSFALSVVNRPELGGIPTRQLPDLLGLFAGWPVLQPPKWPLQACVLACTVLLLVAISLLRKYAHNEEGLKLSFSSAVTAALLAGYSTNTYDISLLVLPLLLVADYCVRRLRSDKQAGIYLFLPVIPLLISPLWFLLWLKWQRTNLIAVFLAWWVFAIRHELIRMQATRSASQVASVIG
jgi:hypothetical protein